MKPGAAYPAPRIVVPERLDPRLLNGFDRAARVVQLEGPTMGTGWTVRLALPPGRDPAPISTTIQTRLDGIVAQMSHWEPSSLLCGYNQATPGNWVKLPPDFAAVVAAALSVAERSDGAFDPAIGRLTDIWGLGPNPTNGAPTRSAITAALEVSGWRRLTFDSQHQRLHQPGGVWLDLSGIAKGYAVDAVADLLDDLGIRHALVEIGGECTGRGIRPDGEPWWVDVETPSGFSLLPLRVALHQLAIATSGDYLRGAHALDPATGQPAIHDTIAVSIIHASCMMADAWASALSVLASAEARDLAEREGLAVRLLSRDGSEWLSGALRSML